MRKTKERPRTNLSISFHKKVRRKRKFRGLARNFEIYDIQCAKLKKNIAMYL